MNTSTTKAQALELFNTMYRERTIRDHYYAILSIAPESEADTVRSAAKDHNAASNKAMQELEQLGYYAYRDEENEYMPTLAYGNIVIAYWDEYKGIIEVTPKADPAIEAIANAVRDIAGFERLFYLAADASVVMNETRKEMKEYEETHKTLSGKTYKALSRRFDEMVGRWVSAEEAITIILEANNTGISSLSLDSAVSEQVAELEKSMTPYDLHRIARGY